MEEKDTEEANGESQDGGPRGGRCVEGEAADKAAEKPHEGGVVSAPGRGCPGRRKNAGIAQPDLYFTVPCSTVSMSLSMRTTSVACGAFCESRGVCLQRRERMSSNSVVLYQCCGVCVSVVSGFLG